eukprot:5764541-Lingulodinium_polyedra.AAC.1
MECKASREMLPLVKASAIVSRVSHHTIFVIIPRSSSSLTHCNWMSNERSAGVLIGLAAIALKT